MKRRCIVCRKPLEQKPSGRRRQYCDDGGSCRQAAYRRRNRRLRGSLEVMTSSRSGDWATDPAVYQQLAVEFGGFELDPCASHDNHKCARYFTADDDGLEREWTGRVFMNPPYGRTLGRTLGHWMQKAWEASQSTAELVVCLVPARTDVRWWHEYAVRGEVRFVKGRLRFGDLRAPAPFPSAIVVFRNAQAVTKQPSDSECEAAA